MAKQSWWAVRSGELITIQTTHAQYRSLIRAGESSEQTVLRLGFKTIGGFTTDPQVKFRSTAKVVAL